MYDADDTKHQEGLGLVLFPPHGFLSSSFTGFSHVALLAMFLVPFHWHILERTTATARPTRKPRVKLTSHQCPTTSLSSRLLVGSSRATRLLGILSILDP